MTRIRLARCPTCHQRMRRSNEANRRYWALIHAISSRLLNARFSAESWHLYLKSRFLGCDDLRLPNGKTFVVPRSTAGLDTAEFSAYMEQVEAWAAERDVFLDEIENAA